MTNPTFLGAKENDSHDEGLTEGIGEQENESAVVDPDKADDKDLDLDDTEHSDNLDVQATDDENSVSQFDPNLAVTEDNDEPPKLNDEGHLVDSDGNKVFTTTEEAIKDGSFVLDDKGRMPGVYLDDIEREQMAARSRRYEEAYNDAAKTDNVFNVAREVNVTNSPLPPVTVPVNQETRKTTE